MFIQDEYGQSRVKIFQSVYFMLQMTRIFMERSNRFIRKGIDKNNRSREPLPRSFADALAIINTRKKISSQHQFMIGNLNASSVFSIFFGRQGGIILAHQNEIL